jgi:hypothetical protein
MALVAYYGMRWEVKFDDTFESEFAKLLEEFGPQLGRPQVDTLKGSKATCVCIRSEAPGGVVSGW